MPRSSETAAFSEHVEQIASEVIANYDDAQEWYAPTSKLQFEQMSSSTYKYAIICPSTLQHSVQPLFNWEVCKGNSPVVVTMEQIESESTGIDRAEKIRNYLRSKLHVWGIEYVLLVGTLSDIPVRYYGLPGLDGYKGPTDYYYAELSLPDDQSWDLNQDGIYGERGNDVVDFIAEVNVGRIPWSNPSTVEEICRKIVNFEYSDDLTYKKRVLLAASFLDDITDSAVLTEKMRNEYLVPDGWSTRRLYENGPGHISTYPMNFALTYNNVKSSLTDVGYGLIVYSGHGSHTHAGYSGGAFIDSSMSSQLDDGKPSIFWGISCQNAWPEDANNLGKSLLGRGAVAFGGCSRSVIYAVGWSQLDHGRAFTMAYLFNKAVQEGKPLGQALNESHTLMHDVYGHNTDWNQIFLYMLYGSPSTRVAGRSAGLTNLMPMKGIGWLAPLLVTNTPQTPGTQITMPIHLNTGAFYVHTRCARNEPAQTPEFSSVIKFNGETIASEVFSQGSDRYLENYNYEASAPEGGRHTLEFMSKILEIPLAVGGTYCVVIVNESDTVYGYSLKVEESQAIEGTILDQNGYPMSGVSLAGFPDDITTGSNEDYRALVHKGWSGIVTRLLIDCLFTPQSRTYTNVTTDFVNEDYTGNLQCGNVTFTPDGGAYTSSQSVTMTCSTSNVQIHYTTNGLDPTQNDPSVLSGETESALAERPPFPRPHNDSNETILTSASSNAIVTSTTGVTGTARLDGFTISGNTIGRAITIDNSNSVIANNTINDNASTGYGGGIMLNGSSSVVTGNIIRDNTASRGGGIACVSSNVVLVNNMIFDNQSSSGGGGVYLEGGSPVLTNNTLVSNYDSNGGGGLRILNSSASVSNNILSWSPGGGIKNSGGSPTLRDNCVFRNKGYDCDGVAPGTGDISVDPMFADLSINDLHILVESPCVNAGWSQAPGLTQYDIDGDLRVFAGMVDIGADECVGLSNRVIHISPLGNDADNGFSWTTAKQTIQGGIYAAIQGDEVWVAAGEYLGQITLEHYVKVYGGFAGTETSLEHRPAFPRLPEGPANSLLDGLLSGSVVTAVGGQNEFCRLDGFAITNGGGVQNGGGIYVQNSSPTITNNVIVGNTASNGAGIYTVLSASLIEGNLFCQNTASGNGGAVFTQGTSVRLANNVMLENSASAGGGIFANQSSARIINNTIVENQAHGILIQGGSPHVVNTIVAFNNQGIAETGSSAVLRNSNLFGNTDGDYMGFVFLQNCISGNPQFTDWEKRIPAQSPCVNAGTLYTSWIPQTDRDGNPRLLHGMVDIGAYEVQFSGTPVSIKDAILLPDGASVEIDGAIVSATWDDFFYISADDRSSGIRVDRIGHGLLSGMRADITGTITTIAPDGERYLAAVQAVRNGTGVVEPLGISNKSLGGGSFAFNPLTGAGQCGVHEGTGLNNIGLLVRVWGKVLGMDSSPTPQWMYIDDGSGKVITAIVEDGTMVLEQKWVDSYVAITGISSCWHDGNKIHPVIRLKTVQVFAMN